MRRPVVVDRRAAEQVTPYSCVSDGAGEVVRQDGKLRLVVGGQAFGLRDNDAARRAQAALAVT